MGIIKELDQETASLIAAGEVVERPVSIVKELVENAIDAGATMITVRIERGGISRIQVTDNGCAMMREDALNCFKRHATSKITKAEDLNSTYTLGFRGEALSSIAAVAQVDLMTKREQDEIGTHVFASDGEIRSCVDEGMPNGTTFIVANVFYNVPARMKFLRRDTVEASYITDLMARFILSHPEISFRYLNSRKEVYFSAGDGNLLNCIYTVYGKDYAKQVLPVDYKHDYITITGFIGKSEVSRPNHNYQSFFINKRYVKSLSLSRKVDEAYKNQVMTGKFPMCVLNINIDASLIDINVHPNKQEVKFSSDREGEILTALYRAVENTLFSDYSIPEFEIPKKKITSAFKADIVKSDAQYELEWEKNKNRWSPAEEIPFMKEKEWDFKKEIQNLPDTYKSDISPEYFAKRRREIIKENLVKYMREIEPALKEPVTEIKDFKYPESRTPFKDAIYNLPDNIEKEHDDIKAEEKITDVKMRSFKVIGQIFSTYILVEEDDKLLIIDQHAAHERLKYEELKKELENKKVSAQDLLFSTPVDLTPVEYEIYKNNEELLVNLGFECDDFGENSVVVRTAPAYVEFDDVPELLIDILEQIEKNKDKPISQKAEYAVYTIACKAAVKANHQLDIKELEALCEEIFKIEPINTCPHGRPITISMTKRELEKEFKRIL